MVRPLARSACHTCARQDCAGTGISTTGRSAEAMNSLPLEVTGLSKSFGGAKRLLWRKAKAPVAAVRDMSFRVERGEIYGVIGANGSGKSTLVRMISTLLTPDAGSGRGFGLEIGKQELEGRRLLNRVSPDPSFFPTMSAL